MENGQQPPAPRPPIERNGRRSVALNAKGVSTTRTGRSFPRGLEGLAATGWLSSLLALGGDGQEQPLWDPEKEGLSAFSYAVSHLSIHPAGYENGMAAGATSGRGGFVVLNLVLAALTLAVFLSTRRLKLAPSHVVVLNALSCGILVGAVLGIILPEGFEAQQAGGKGREASGIPILIGYAFQLLLDNVGTACRSGHHHHSSVLSGHPKHSPLPTTPRDAGEYGMEEDSERLDSLTVEASTGRAQEGGNGRFLSDSRRTSSALRSPWSSEDENIVEMTSVEGVPPGVPPATRASQAHFPPPSTSAACRGGRQPGRSSNSPVEPWESHRDHYRPSQRTSKARGDGSLPALRGPSGPTLLGSGDGGSPQPAFLGLLVHCLADGVALGASSLGTSSLQLTVYLALMIHKLPVAFATGTLLAKSLAPRTGPGTLRPPHQRLTQTQQLEQEQEQQPSEQEQRAKSFLYHALAFSLASPLAALSTHLILRVQQRQQTKEGVESLNHNTTFVGSGLLFSAGTFLYVSVGHIMPELLHSHEHVRNTFVTRAVVLLLLIMGMFAVPLLARLAPDHGFR